MTAQVHEQLILNGEQTSLLCLPKVPRRHPRVVEQTDSAARESCMHTACWRGYVGTWQVEDQKLFLVELAGRYALSAEGPLFADWVSTTLVIPRGEHLVPMHGGFGGTWARNLELRVRRGIVRSSREVNNAARAATALKRIRRSYGGLS